MKDDPAAAPREGRDRVVASVLLFWVGYVAVTLVVGFVTSTAIPSEVWQLTAWGLISSALLVAMSRLFTRNEKGPRTDLDLAVHPGSLKRLSMGMFVGVASFGVHVGVISVFAGPVHFEWVPGVGAMAAAIYFVRFLATSCMEEVGFRGYSLRRLTPRIGPRSAVGVTAVAFGLSHLSYGWDLQTIALGVVPGGLLWGMSAIATRGLAVPIGLHAAWNFAGWTAGARSETGLLQMVVDDEVVERTQQVGTVSYLATFASLALVFWFLYRRNVRLEQEAAPRV